MQSLPFSLSRIASVVVVAAVLGYADSASAGYKVLTGKIVNIGCHTVGDVCYVTVPATTTDFPETLSETCRNNSFRWTGTTDGGKMTLSALMAAFLSGKSVALAISDQCFSGQNGFPTFAFYAIVQ